MSQQALAYTEFKATNAWNPSADKVNTCLAIKRGDYGRVYNVNGKWTEVLMQNPNRKGWVTSLDLLPTAVYPAAAISPVERALSAGLDQVKQAIQTTKQLTFLTDDAKKTLGTDHGVQYLKNAIISGMPKKLFGVLNRASYNIQDLVDCERVEWDSGAGIYARIYQLPDKRVFVYIGSSGDMWARGNQHSHSTSNGTVSRHYNIARQAVRTVVLVLTRIKDPILYAEQSMIFLFGSYFGYMTEQPKSGDGILDWVSDNWQAYTLTNTTTAGFGSVGWIPVTKKLGLHGCNIKSPAAGGADTTKLIWVRMRNKENTVAMIRRRPQALGRSKREGNIYLVGQNQINVRLDPAEELVVGTQVYSTFEMRLDGRPHEAPLFRLPLVGGFSDWREISTIGVKMEWNTSKGWRAKYVQRIQMNPSITGQVQHAPVLYIQGSALLAAFKSQIFDNPSGWREQLGPLRIVDVWFDRRTQEVQIRENMNLSRIPEPTRRPLEEVRNELSGLGFLFVKTGEWPLVHGKTRDSCDSCCIGHVKKFECLGKISCNHCMLDGRPCTWTPTAQLKANPHLTQTAMPTAPSAEEREFGTVDLDENLVD
ncbi:MAG: hypothetical protein Q9197_001179 [Variospora fuerteventurae]